MARKKQETGMLMAEHVFLEGEGRHRIDIVIDGKRHEGESTGYTGVAMRSWCGQTFYACTEYFAGTFPVNRVFIIEEL
jgi:hypothetical protein